MKKLFDRYSGQLPIMRLFFKWSYPFGRKTKVPAKYYSATYMTEAKYKEEAYKPILGNLKIIVSTDAGQP